MRCNKCMGLIRTKDICKFGDSKGRNLKLIRILLRCACGNQEVLELENIQTVEESIKGEKSRKKIKN